jgi:2,3-bisphosphoglycerate-independent phosphoglycerate mutase
MVKQLTKGKSARPVVLIIMDGWGIAKPSAGNAITQAKTPAIDYYTKNFPNTLLAAHGSMVGLPRNQDGNSEAGHMNIGAGRIIEQDSVLISKSIKSGIFFKNAAFLEAINHVKRHRAHGESAKLHIMGLLSNHESAHSSPDHVFALFKLCREQNLKDVYLHLFTDGRDSSQYAAIKFLKKLEREFVDGMKIATISGRYYAMDRASNWPRTELAYNALVLGKGVTAVSPEEAIVQSYNRGLSDEFIIPTVIVKDNKPVATIDNKDSLIFFNLRSDRARQMAKPFLQHDFNGFKRRKVLKDFRFVAMTDFGPELPNILTAFPSNLLKDTLPMVLQKERQLYIAEREKYSHITYFLNGGYANPCDGENRIVVKSPDVPTYDLKPQMSASEITKIVLQSLGHNLYDFIAINFANPDMVGHTGNLAAGIKAVEYVDKCVGEIVDPVLKEKGNVIITADHGNVEEMVNLKTGEIDTEHSTNPVPFILVSRDRALRRSKLKGGILADVAPTILKIMDVKKPRLMTRRGLL